MVTVSYYPDELHAPASEPSFRKPILTRPTPGSCPRRGYSGPLARRYGRPKQATIYSGPRSYSVILSEALRGGVEGPRGLRIWLGFLELSHEGSQYGLCGENGVEGIRGMSCIGVLRLRCSRSSCEHLRSG